MSNRTSKSRDHVAHLHRRLTLWKEGDLSALLDEGRCIQRHLRFRGVLDKDRAARIFNNLMLQGKVHSALRYLSCHSSSGVLNLDAQVPVRSSNGDTVMTTVHEALLDKHPLGKPPDPSTLLGSPPSTVNPILFDGLNADAIRSASLRTTGAAGPSGLDAIAWRRLCCVFKSASVTLCSALAAVGHRLCTEAVHPDGLSAFVACRLIPLDKQPGVRPIGIGEVPRRIIAKAVLHLVDLDVREACGALQVCAGCEGGCEAAVHAVRQLFDDPGSQAVLLVDASNAFNSVNRQAALHNILRICPSLAQILINTYQRPVRLIIPGSGGLMSTEGTTQGDPLAMAMYALAVTPLIHHLHSSDPAVSQVWYADDATGVGKCAALRKWWDTLSQLGPLFGYIPNASKTYLVVKDKYVAAARRAFSGTGVVISADGQRHLGAAIGHRDYTATYVTSKVQAWCNDVKRLAEVADIFPHAAYAAFTHGLFSRWSYLMRTIPDITDFLQPLEDVIHQSFIPALFGHPPCSSIERDLYALPVRLGGLGLMNPCSAASSAFHDSEKLTAPLVALITAQCMTQTVDRDHVCHLKQSIRKNNRDHQTLLADTLHSQLSPSLKRCADLAREPGSSSWLTVLPIQEHGFHLHKGDFRDALFLRYGITPLNTSKTCQCGTSFSVDHAMVCPFGGFPTIRHNEVRDLTASLLTEVSHNVQTEPSLQPVTTETFSLASANTADDARLDIKTRGFWSRGQDAYFDVRVFYPNASSYRSLSLNSAYKRHEDAKKREYGHRVRDLEHGVFTPLVFTSTGSMGCEATVFYRRLADLLATHWGQQYSQTINWLRCRLSFALLRCAIMCIRGSRSSTHRPVLGPLDLSVVLAESRLTN